MKPTTLFLVMLGVIAIAGIVAGCVLAITGYSSAGPFAVASACVGVLGTLATERVHNVNESSRERSSSPGQS